MKKYSFAFVSVLTPFREKNLILYPDIQGKEYSSIQTNESAIVYLARMLGKDPLSKIFLIVSNKVKNEFIGEKVGDKFVAADTEFGKITRADFFLASNY